MSNGAGAGAAHRGGARVGHAALGLAAAVVLLQVSYPLLHGAELTAVTITSVLVFAAASLTSALAAGGARAALLLAVVAGGVGLGAEAAGVATGVPFGPYAYTHTLGPEVFGVPLLVPAAWLMMAWPCLIAGRRVAAAAGWPTAASIALAAWALASWDLFLDPQMVAAGHWHWASPTPNLPGVAGIPISNFAGWLVVAVVIQVLLHAVLPNAVLPDAAVTGRRDDPAVVLLLGWTWLGSALAAAVFFGRPGVAAWGLVAMGVVIGPYLAVVTRSRRRGAHERIGIARADLLR